MTPSNLPHTSATLRYRRVPSFVPRTEYQLIAALIWIAGMLATELLVRSLGCPYGLSYVVAIAVQYGISKIEAPMWRQQKNVISLLVLTFDVVINAAGVAPIAQRIGATPVWDMLVKLNWANTSVAYGIVVGIAVVIGFVIAAAPEKIWKW